MAHTAWRNGAPVRFTRPTAAAGRPARVAAVAELGAAAHLEVDLLAAGARSRSADSGWPAQARPRPTCRRPVRRGGADHRRQGRALRVGSSTAASRRRGVRPAARATSRSAPRRCRSAEQVADLVRQGGGHGATRCRGRTSRGSRRLRTAWALSTSYAQSGAVSSSSSRNCSSDFRSGWCPQTTARLPPSRRIRSHASAPSSRWAQESGAGSRSRARRSPRGRPRASTQRRQSAAGVPRACRSTSSLWVAGPPAGTWAPVRSHAPGPTGPCWSTWIRVPQRRQGWRSRR